MATTGTKVPSIYKIPTKADPELKQFANSVKEALEVRLGRRGDPRDRAITLRELIDSGLAKELKNNPFDPNTGFGVTDFAPPTFTSSTIPPTPTGFSVSAAYSSFILSWDNPQYNGLAYTEVWRSDSDDIAAAVRVDTTRASVWSEVVDYNTTYFYWVRHVSTSDVIGAFSSSGTGTTAVDIGAVMTSLSETLAALPGYDTLINTSVPNLIATAKAEAIASGTKIIKSDSEPSTREDSSALQAQDIWIDTNDNNQMYVRDGSSWEEARDGTLVTLIGTTSFTGSDVTAALATAQSNVVTLTTANAARVTEITELEAITTGYSNSSTIAAAITSEATARASGDTANANDITTLETTVNHGTTGVAANATAVSNLSTAVGLSGTASTKITALESTVNNGSTGVAANASAIGTLNTSVATKSSTFAQASAPADNSANDLEAGDIWVDTNDGNKMYAWNDSTNAWYLIRDVGKSQTFVANGAPADDTANDLEAGDIWIVSDDNNELQVWSGSSWDSRRDGLTTAHATAITGINTSITNLQSHEQKTFVQDAVPNGGSVIVKAGDLWIDTNDSNKVYRATADNAAAIVTSGNGWLLTDIQGTTASVASVSTAVTTLEGDAAAAYVLQVNANGSVAGMVIENTASSAGDNSGSAIQFRADKFAIWNATGSDAGSGSVAPFILDSGVVYIDMARIKDAAITNAKIGDLSADKINAGTLAAARIAAGSLDAAKITANTLNVAGIAIDGTMGRVIYATADKYDFTYNTTAYTNFATDYAAGREKALLSSPLTLTTPPTATAIAKSFVATAVFKVYGLNTSYADMSITLAVSTDSDPSDASAWVASEPYFLGNKINPVTLQLGFDITTSTSATLTRYIHVYGWLYDVYGLGWNGSNDESTGNLGYTVDVSVTGLFR